MTSPLHDLILTSKDIESEIIPVPEWNCEIEIRGLDVASRGEIFAKIAGQGGNILDLKKFSIAVLIATAHDPKTGERIFTEEDAESISLKSAAVVERLSQAGIRVSKLNPEAVDQLGKGSLITPNGASSSASPNISVVP